MLGDLKLTAMIAQLTEQFFDSLRRGKLEDVNAPGDSHEKTLAVYFATMAQQLAGNPLMLRPNDEAKLTHLYQVAADIMAKTLSAIDDTSSDTLDGCRAFFYDLWKKIENGDLATALIRASAPRTPTQSQINAVQHGLSDLRIERDVVIEEHQTTHRTLAADRKDRLQRLADLTLDSVSSPRVMSSLL